MTSVAKYVVAAVLMAATTAHAQISSTVRPNGGEATSTGTQQVGNAETIAQVPSVAALAAIPAGKFGAVYRAGYAAAGDGGDALFVWQKSSCSHADGGSQVSANDGVGCWVAQFPRASVDPRIWGARCSVGEKWSSPPDATAAIQAASDYLSGSNGGTIDVHCPMQVSGTVVLGSGVELRGIGTIYYKGMLDMSGSGAAVSPTWPPASGPALNCAAPVESCIVAAGTGVHIDNLNFGNVQPAPASSGAWTPAAFGYVIGTRGNWNGLLLDHLTFTSADKCVDLEGSANYNRSGIAGAQWTIHDLWMNACLQTGIRFHDIDNTGRVDDVDFDFWWYRNDPAVGRYYTNNAVGMDVSYLANAQINNVEFAYNRVGFRFTNSTVTGGDGQTFASAKLQLSNIGFNLVCQGFSMPNGNGTVTGGSMVNIVAASDNAFGCTAANPIFFDLSSDKANWSLSHIKADSIQTLAAIGHGGGGNLTVNDVDVGAYSAFAAGANAFKVAAKSAFYLDGNAVESIRPGTGAGALVGPGAGGTQGHQQPFQVGGGSGINPTVDGAAQLNAGDSSHSGYSSFFLPNGTRIGLVGYGTADGINLQADAGSLYLKPNAGARGAPTLQVGSSGPTLLLNVNGLPTSCGTRGSALPAGTIVDVAGALRVCP